MTKMRRFWMRLWSSCWFKHVGTRIRVYRGGQLYIECGECDLEIRHTLPDQVPRIEHAVNGRDKPITTKGDVLPFKRRKA